MSIKENQIVNYFISDKSSDIKVFKAPVIMSSSMALKLLQKKDNNLSNNLMHYCYDVFSKRIYFLNKNEFTESQINRCFPVFKEKLKEDFSNTIDIQPINGSPFDTIRIRNIHNFINLKESMSLNKNGYIKNIPVIEANLKKMPSVERKIEDLFGKIVDGKYISKSLINGVKFIDETNNNEVLLSQKAPFILIDISKNPSSTEKEWMILNSYQHYLSDKSVFGVLSNNIDSLSFVVKRFLQLGWSFEEICDVIVKDVEDFPSLMYVCDTLNELNPFNNKNYYVTFQINDDFPVDFSGLMENDKFIKEKQIDFFEFVDFDKETQFIIVKTPIYIKEKVWKDVFKTTGAFLMATYNIRTETIDIKTNENCFNILKNGTLKQQKQLKKIKKLCYNTDIPFRCDFNTFYTRNIGSFYLKNTSDFPECKRILEEISKKNNFNFEDVNILVGPIQKLLGEGITGGFVDKKLFKKNKWDIPFEIIKGIKIKPPIIFIDSVSRKTPADHLAVIIHEYCHNIWNVQHPNYEHKYLKDLSLKNKNEKEYWKLYLTDEDEKQAHIEEIKFELKSGKSVDEIILEKVGGFITESNYYIAMLFKSIIDIAIEQMEEEDGRETFSDV